MRWKLRNLRSISLRNLAVGDDNAHRLLDAFYSIHVDDRLAYISEVVRRNSDPDFNYASIPPSLSHRQKFTVKVWCRGQRTENKPENKPENKLENKLENKPDNDCDTNPWRLLCSVSVDLSKLIYVGDAPLGTNAMVFDLGGFRHAFPHCVVDIGAIGPCSAHTSRAPVASYSLDALRAIVNLAGAVAELSHAKHKVSRQITASLAGSRAGPTAAQRRAHRDYLQFCIIKTHSENAQLHQEKLRLETVIHERTKFATESTPLLDQLSAQISLTHSDIEPIDAKVSRAIFPSTANLLAYHTNTIKEILPIEATEGTVKYSIMGLEFPSSFKDLLDICYYNKSHLANYNMDPDIPRPDHDEITHINSAIAYIVQLLRSLAYVTDKELRHQILLHDSQPYIIDVLDEKRKGMFPLFFDVSQLSKQPDPMHSDAFERGLRLLNSNIIILSTGVLDTYNAFTRADHNAIKSLPAEYLDNLLWNLQYLILFVTADHQRDCR